MRVASLDLPHHLLGAAEECVNTFHCFFTFFSIFFHTKTPDSIAQHLKPLSDQSVVLLRLCIRRWCHMYSVCNTLWSSCAKMSSFGRWVLTDLDLEGFLKIQFTLRESSQDWKKQAASWDSHFVCTHFKQCSTTRIPPGQRSFLKVLLGTSLKAVVTKERHRSIFQMTSSH